MSGFRRDCDRCGHSSDWHSFKGDDILAPDAKFSCNGENFDGCDGNCPDFVDPPGWEPPCE